MAHSFFSEQEEIWGDMIYQQFVVFNSFLFNGNILPR